MKLEGKTARITWATSGIGLATARLFVEEGAHVAIVGRDAAKLDAVRAELGERVVKIQADVRNVDDLQRMQDVVKRRLGVLDVFFANAGVAFSTPLDGTTPAQYDTLMDINVKGVFLSMQAVTPVLRDGASVILNTSWLNQVGTPGLSLLSASKAAVRSLARTWSSELLSRRIRVNAVSSGATDTPIHGRGGGQRRGAERQGHLIHRKLTNIQRTGCRGVRFAVLYYALNDLRYC